MTQKKKFVKFAEPLSFRAKPEEMELLRKYCAENKLDLLMVVENIPEDKFNDFDRFLIDNKILEDE